MKLFICFVILYASHSWALVANWAIEAACDRQQITDAFKEALDLIRTAIKVLDTNSDNERVKSMGHYLFKDDIGFALGKERLAPFHDFWTSPSQFTPDQDEWKRFRSNRDVEIYCSTARLENRDKNMGFDKSIDREIAALDYQSMLNCHSPTWQGPATAMTTASDWFNEVQFLAAGGEGVATREHFMTPRVTKPYTMDICAWYLNLRAGEPSFNIDKLVDVIVKGSNGQIAAGGTQADMMQTLGTTILHELCHTLVGGRLVDIDHPNSYGWQRAGQIQVAVNADNIMFLVLAMNVFNMGYWIQDDGLLQVL